MEHRRKHGKHHSKSGQYYHLYGNSNQRCGLQRHGKRNGNGEPLAHAQCKCACADMRRAKRKFNRIGRHKLYLEHGFHFRHHQRESGNNYHLHSNGNQCQRLQRYGKQNGNGEPASHTQR